MSIVAVITTYNDEVYIKDIVKQTALYVDEVIVVDDGSIDATKHIAKTLGAHVITPKKNNCKTSALHTVFNEARKFNPKILVTLYGNGMHNPEDIPKLVNPILWSEADFVSGSHSEDYYEGKAGDIDNIEKYNSFNAYSSRVFGEFEFKEIGDVIGPELLPKAMNIDFRIKEVPVTRLSTCDEKIFKKYHIGVVVPAYNEEKLIKVTVDGIPDYVNRIYVINDASTDNTAQVIESLNDPRIFVITHEVNKGVGAAIVNGYKQALKENADIIAVMAGDNQMNPAQLSNLLLPIIEGKADYTKGNRLINAEFRCGMSRWRLVGNAMLTLITKIGSGYWHIMDPQNGYTAISKKALVNIEIDTLYTYYGYCNDLLVKLNTFGFRTIDVVMPARYGQERSTIMYKTYIGKVSLMLFRKFLGRLKMKYMILSFHPLVLFYILGMIFIPFGVLFAVYIIIAKMILHWHVSPNYPLLDVLILIFGLQFVLFAMLFDMQENNNDIRFGEPMCKNSGNREWNYTRTL
ncbi:MAG: Glycosyltransferase [Candidatus Methanomarinus sp.]|nr:MAG: Glycosyltransferase [ANME-2 cluster archaeon]